MADCTKSLISLSDFDRWFASDFDGWLASVQTAVVHHSPTDGSQHPKTADWPSLMNKAWKHQEFVALSSQIKGSIGTHSVRKFPCTWAAGHGVSQDHTEIRGRWKGARNGQTVNRYINVEQLPTDGTVASVLCIGGPIRYLCHPGCGLTLEWMHEHVVPGIYNHFKSD
jgi:hypothetical protein